MNDMIVDGGQGLGEAERNSLGIATHLGVVGAISVVYTCHY
jgi:deoxyinosine 3'endonuclease (endonuclease V)